MIKIKRLHVDAKLPRRAMPGDAGVDLFSCQDATIIPGAYELIPCGIAVELPLGTEGQIRPRSGLAVKHGVTVLNSPRTVDCGYRGEIQVCLVNLENRTVSLPKGIKQ